MPSWVSFERRKSDARVRPDWQRHPRWRLSTFFGGQLAVEVVDAGYLGYASLIDKQRGAWLCAFLPVNRVEYS